MSSFGLSLDSDSSAGHRPERKIYLVTKRKIRQFPAAHRRYQANFLISRWSSSKESTAWMYPCGTADTPSPPMITPNTNLGFIDIGLEWMRVQADRE
ncbi:hypothetical protein I6F21_26620 [Bradyrhizobium sp. NBAIM03]|uniref:hypothetical protein n=1 Tax=Bradyrhizobium sp. NBAIM03 TaxID=2793816 RepID=UPI001CD5D372|nr:hypothetical protein [Bradyrhizobium sp. NBAIM03]MCA1536112.1 hypothetical protein [Bradyrhizobium sp. NBAIM03]